MTTFPRGIKLYRKLRNRKGYGVHSPFVYRLITKVIEENNPYYAYAEIENVRQQFLSGNDFLSKITRQETQSCHYGALLFRLVNFFKCRHVLQVGCSTGVMSLYLAMASRNDGRCVGLEDRPGLTEPVRAVAAEMGLQHLFFVTGNYDETLPAYLQSEVSPDLIFVNSSLDAATAEKAIAACLACVRSHTILVIDGIDKNSSMRNLWIQIKEHPLTTVTVDLNVLGLVSFDRKRCKQHFKTYFDHEKKQNIHANGRRRFHFLRRRKKSSKNPFKA